MGSSLQVGAKIKNILKPPPSGTEDEQINSYDIHLSGDQNPHVTFHHTGWGK